MPLTWDLSEVKDWEIMQGEEGEARITDVIIYGTIFCGIGHITEKNADEFYARMHILEGLNGNFLLATRNGEKIDRPLMPYDIYRRIGLRTNAAWKDESRTKWMSRHITKGALRDAVNLYNRAVKEDFKGRFYTFEEPEDKPVATATA